MLLYAKGPIGRKDEYTLLTTIEKDADGQLWVHKKALRRAADGHIDTILKNYTLLAPRLNNSLLLPKPERQSESELRMPFIAGENLDQTLYRLLRDKSENRIIALFSEILNLIEHGGTPAANPGKNPKYRAVFGEHYNTRTECSSLGLVDLNLDNFIRTKDGFYLVDYEWFFDFLIPVHYLFGRLLYYSFSLKFDKLMRRYASPRHPVVYLSPTFVVPRKVYEHFKPFFDDAGKIMATENALQAFTHAHAASISLEASESKPRISTEPERPYIDSLYVRTLDLEKENKELRAIAEDFRKDILGLGDELGLLRQENAQLSNLQFVKLINRIKRYIKRQNK